MSERLRLLTSGSTLDLVSEPAKEVTVKIYWPGDVFEVEISENESTQRVLANVVNQDTGPGGAVLGYQVSVRLNGEETQMFVDAGAVTEEDPNQESLLPREPERLRRAIVTEGQTVRIVQRPNRVHSRPEFIGKLRYWGSENISLDMGGFYYTISVLELAGVYAA
jgi:hypothetical protein